MKIIGSVTENSGLNASDYFKAILSTKDFMRLSEFIMNEYGIKMPPAKKIMLQTRLQKRLRDLNIANFKEYVDYVFTPQGQKDEVIHMIDVVSTNKTDFFREPSHFDFLLSDMLPEYYKQETLRPVKIWSAGCSSGEEPYTLAVVCSEFAAYHPGFDFSIYATDISTRMLRHAFEAIYKEEKIEIIPKILKGKYFLRSKDRSAKKVKVISELRRRVLFSRLNLISDKYVTPDIYDMIFCRNVLIYFDRIIQENILAKLCARLKPGGTIFLGHSESITGFNLPLRHIKPTIFKKSD